MFNSQFFFSNQIKNNDIELLIQINSFYFNQQLEAYYQNNQKFQETKDFLEHYQPSLQTIKEKNLNQIIIDLLSEFNKHEKVNSSNCQLPNQIIDGKSLWMTNDDQFNQHNWIGHGYYWQPGEGQKDSASCLDYDCFENDFFKFRNAKVLLADYELLRKDFQKDLQFKTDEEINEWLVNNCAFMSIGQLKRISNNGDLAKMINIEKLDDFFYPDQRKAGLRQRGFGRAATFIVNDELIFETNGSITAKMLNVKGIGTHKLATDYTIKENGLLSIIDALKEYAMQKMIQKLGHTQKWGTVESYAVIDIGLKMKKGIKNPATGYLNERFGLLIRQSHSRYVATYSDGAFFSVVPSCAQIHSEFVLNFKRTLLNHGISSELEPVGIIKGIPIEKQLLLEETEWNIQADATLTKFVDFSQYYIAPISTLVDWRMTANAYQRALALGTSWKIAIIGEENLQRNFLLKNVEEVMHFIETQRKLDQDNFSTEIGFRKPRHSWSWFLETDDSNVNKWAFARGQQKSDDSNLSLELSEFLDFERLE